MDFVITNEFFNAIGVDLDSIESFRVMDFFVGNTCSNILNNYKFCNTGGNLIVESYSGGIFELLGMINSVETDGDFKLDVSKLRRLRGGDHRYTNNIMYLDKHCNIIKIIDPHGCSLYEAKYKDNKIISSKKLHINYTAKQYTNTTYYYDDFGTLYKKITNLKTLILKNSADESRLRKEINDFIATIHDESDFKFYKTTIELYDINGLPNNSYSILKKNMDCYEHYMYDKNVACYEHQFASYDIRYDNYKISDINYLQYTLFYNPKTINSLIFMYENNQTSFVENNDAFSLTYRRNRHFDSMSICEFATLQNGMCLCKNVSGIQDSKTEFPIIILSRKYDKYRNFKHVELSNQVKFFKDAKFKNNIVLKLETTDGYIINYDDRGDFESLSYDNKPIIYKIKK